MTKNPFWTEEIEKELERLHKERTVYIPHEPVQIGSKKFNLCEEIKKACKRLQYAYRKFLTLRQFYRQSGMITYQHDVEDYLLNPLLDILKELKRYEEVCDMKC